MPKAACCPWYNLVLRPPLRTLFSDASKPVVGGYRLETGFWWRYTFDENERARFCGYSTMVTGENDISINIAELLGMVMSAWMLVILCGERPDNTCNSALLRGDNESAVQWVKRCRGGREPRSGALMRLLGALELVMIGTSTPNTSEAFSITSLMVFRDGH